MRNGLSCLLALLLLAAAGTLQAGDECSPSITANPDSGDLVAGGGGQGFTVTVGLGDCPDDENIGYEGSITYTYGSEISTSIDCETNPTGTLNSVTNPTDEYECGFEAGKSAAAGETAVVTAGVGGFLEPDPPAVEAPAGFGQATIATFTVVRRTNLTVTKTGGGDVNAPDTFSHTISVTNFGPSDSTEIVLTDVTDALPAGVTGPTYGTPSHGSVVDNVWTINGLADLGTATLQVNYEATTNSAFGTVNDTATVAPNSENAGSTDLSDDEYSDVIPVVDIAVTSTESIDPVVAGSGASNLTYIVTATNEGPGDAAGLELGSLLTWPTGVSVVSVTPSVGSWSNAWPGTWTVGTLANAASATLTIVLTVGTGAAEGTDVINLSAEVTAVTGQDSDAANDSTSQATSIVWASATFEVTKEYFNGDGGPVTASLNCSDSGGNIEYVPASDATPASLTVERFSAGASCEVVEALPAGYVAIERSDDCDINPVTNGGAYSCLLTNAQIRATFEVTKDFTDGNPNEVEVTINCFTGLPLQQSQLISESQDVVFVVTDYDPGELDCEITEEIPNGYSPDYVISGNVGDLGIAGSMSGGPERCEFTEVVTGEFRCHIVNTPDPVDIVIHKEWVIEGSGGDDVDTSYTLTLWCDGEIIGGEQIGLGVDAPAGPAPSGCGLSSGLDAGQTQAGGNWCKEFHGDGSDTFVAEVIPIYPESDCEVIETVFDSSVEIDNDCGFLEFSAGEGASCTITNTVFFEGIPSLNQYGLAILALLMLGAGVIGFRRFV